MHLLLTSLDQRRTCVKAADQLCIWPSNLWICFYQTTMMSISTMVDILIIDMGRLLPAMDMDMLLPELPMVDMLLSAMDMSLPKPPRWICSPQPWVWICFSLIRIWIGLYQKRPMVDMLLLTTIMDMPLSTTDGSTMGRDMNTNTQEHSLLLDRGESS